MTCEETLELLDAYHDEELPEAERRLVAQHLLACQSCVDRLAELERLRLDLRALGPHPMPPDLGDRVREALTGVESADSAASGRWIWARHLAAAAVGAAVATLVLLGSNMPAPDPGDTTLLVDAHIRSLQPGHLVDIASSEPHLLQPWFAGRIDLAPVIPQLNAQGWELLGARLDYFGGAPAAAVALRRRAHIVNVFIRGGPGDSAEPAVADLHGYRIVRWRDGDLHYAAVSDLRAAELAELRGLIQATAAAGSRLLPPR